MSALQLPVPVPGLTSSLPGLCRKANEHCGCATTLLAVPLLVVPHGSPARCQILCCHSNAEEDFCGGTFW